MTVTLWWYIQYSIDPEFRQFSPLLPLHPQIFQTLSISPRAGSGTVLEIPSLLPLEPTCFLPPIYHSHSRSLESVGIYWDRRCWIISFVVGNVRLRRLTIHKTFLSHVCISEETNGQYSGYIYRLPPYAYWTMDRWHWFNSYEPSASNAGFYGNDTCKSWIEEMVWLVFEEIISRLSCYRVLAIIDSEPRTRINHPWRKHHRNECRRFVSIQGTRRNSRTELARSKSASASSIIHHREFFPYFETWKRQTIPWPHTDLIVDWWSMWSRFFFPFRPPGSWAATYHHRRRRGNDVWAKRQWTIACHKGTGDVEGPRPYMDLRTKGSRDIWDFFERK